MSISGLNIQEYEFVTDAWLADIGPEEIIRRMQADCELHGVGPETIRAKALEIRLVYAEMDSARSFELITSESLAEQLDNLRKLKASLRNGE